MSQDHGFVSFLGALQVVLARRIAGKRHVHFPSFRILFVQLNEKNACVKTESDNHFPPWPIAAIAAVMPGS